MIDINKILQQKKSYHIVCTGDSTTSAEWVHPNWIDYLEFTLRQETKPGNGRLFKFINSACDGTSLQDIQSRVSEDILFFKPDLVFIMIGLNDMISNKPLSKFRSGLEKIITKLETYDKVQIVLMTPTKPNQKSISDRLRKYAEVIKKVALERELKLIDIYGLFSKIKLKELYTYPNDWGNEVWEMEPGDIDYIHPNILGHRLIAEEILSKLFNLKIPDWGQFGNISTAHIN